MKRMTITMGLLLQVTLLFAQIEKSEIRKGNQLYKAQKYKEAEASYRKSLNKKSQSVEGNFNLGDALYKQKNFKDAAQKFTDLATSANQPDVKAKAYHNLGNSLLEDKKLQESIDAYKKSLLNNPKDEQTRYNLAYAMEKLKQQQQQDKKNKDGKNKNDKNQDQKNKDQQNKDDKNKDQKDKDGKDQKNKDQNKDQKGQQPQPDKLSKEDAERMLQALNNEEKNTQDKLKNKKAKGSKARIVKDW